jgi:hypothetical protein
MCKINSTVLRRQCSRIKEQSYQPKHHNKGWRNVPESSKGGTRRLRIHATRNRRGRAEFSPLVSTSIVVQMACLSRSSCIQALPRGLKICKHDPSSTEADIPSSIESKVNIVVHRNESHLPRQAHATWAKARGRFAAGTKRRSNRLRVWSPSSITILFAGSSITSHYSPPSLLWRNSGWMMRRASSSHVQVARVHQRWWARGCRSPPLKMVYVIDGSCMAILEQMAPAGDGAIRLNSRKIE